MFRMPTFRDNPSSALNFLVALGGAKGDGSSGLIVGGFSDVSGLTVAVSHSECRNDNERFNTVRRGPNTHKLDEVILKRGVIGVDDFFIWLKTVRDGTTDPRPVSITLMDEFRQPLATWTLRNAQPKSWVGPTLAANGDRQLAMEEIHLVHEGIEYK